MSDQFLTTAGSIGAGLVNGSTRILFGWLNDRYSFRSLMAILMGLMLINSCSCWWAAKFPPAFFVCVLLNYFCVGSLWTLLPKTILNVYGKKLGPEIYSTLMFSGFFCSCLNLLTTKFILPVTSYFVMYYISAFVVFLGLVVLFFYKEKLDVEWLKRFNGIIIKG